MMNAKIAVNHEIMGRVSLKNLTHLPIHHVPLAVFKVCTVNIRHRMLLKFRLRLEFVKPRTMIAQMVPYGSIHCTKKHHNHCKNMIHSSESHRVFLRQQSRQCYQQTMNKLIQSSLKFGKSSRKKNIKDRITPQINFFQ